MTVFRDMTRANTITLCEQLARHWAQVCAMPDGLIVVERDALKPRTGAAGTPMVSSSPIAPKDKRPATAASITDGASPASQTLMATTRMTAVVRVRANERDLVMGYLRDFELTVARPNDRPFGFFCYPPAAMTFPARHGGAGVQLDDVIGPPPRELFTGATLGAWRVKTIEILSPAQLISGEPTAEGQYEGEVSIVVAAVPVVLPKPIAAFTITRTGNGDDPSGYVVVWGDRLRLRVGNGAWTEINLTLAGSDTIGEVAAINLGGDWSITGLNGAVSARSSRDLVWVAPGHATVEPGQGYVMSVWG